uniref:F-box domain-containing protein n=1 Tax=Oryza glumipatula TaxID=40148 RepID=A0A0D9ZMB6_9ORYZ
MASNGTSVAEGDKANQEDRLSALPDDILIHILDRLKTRDAVRTSVLSRRWRHLPGVLSKIILHVGSFKPKDGSMLAKDDLRIRSNISVIEATKSILAHKSQCKINFLSVGFYLREESISIAHSINDAMANREIVSTKFIILQEKHGIQRMEDHKIICGKRFMSFSYACPRAFGCLKQLILTCVRLVLQMEHPTLIKMELVVCTFESVDLKSLPKLRTLIVDTWMGLEEIYPLSFGYVPQLSTLKLTYKGTARDKNIKLSEFLGNATIGALHPDFECGRIWIQPEHPKLLAPVLRNLQIASLTCIHEECNLTWIFFLLEAAPLLETMHIKMWDHECKTSEDEELYQKGGDKLLKWESSRDFKHHNLNVLRIVGFQVDEKFMTYIRRCKLDSEKYLLPRCGREVEGNLGADGVVSWRLGWETMIGTHISMVAKPPELGANRISMPQPTETTSDRSPPANGCHCRQWELAVPPIEALHICRFH